MTLTFSSFFDEQENATDITRAHAFNADRDGHLDLAEFPAPPDKAALAIDLIFRSNSCRAIIVQ